jgi:hypothetical protein
MFLKKIVHAFETIIIFKQQICFEYAILFFYI